MPLPPITPLAKSTTIAALPVPAMLLATALGLALSLTACGAAPDKPKPPIVVGVVTIKVQPVPLTTELPGRTAASLVAEVRPQVSGIITGRLFAEGSAVRAGQPLYQIDSRSYAANAAQARAALTAAQATVDSTRLKAERYASLAADGGISKQDAADARAAYNQSRAQVAQARATLAAASVNLGFTRITAPISGRIGQSAVTQGALVTNGQTTALAKIQRLDPLWVNIQQSSGEFIALRRALAQGKVAPDGSAPVRIVLPDGTAWPVQGKLDFADVDVNETTGTVTLRATVPNPGGQLLPGLFVRAQLTQATVTNGILVPQAALSRTPRGVATVYVVGKGDILELREVTATSTVGSDWLVTAGLRPGERVVTEGLLKAKPGAKVTVVPAGSVRPDEPGAGSRAPAPAKGA